MSRTGILIGLVVVTIVGLLVFRFSSFPLSNELNQSKMAKVEEPEFQDWHEFTSPGSKFKVLFPSLPQHATEKLNDPKTQAPRQYDMYVSEKDNGTLFIISQITMPDNPDLKLDETTLANIITEMLAKDPKSKVKKMELSKYRTLPAIDFSIEKDQATVDGKAFLSDHTLYLLTSVSKIGNDNRSEFEFFLNSFQLTSSSETTKDIK